MPTSTDNAPVAIITGAGRGLGREHALALAKAGWHLVVNDLGGAGDGTGADTTPAQQVVAEIEALGGKAVANGANVANWQQAGEMIQQAVDTFGRLDGLVNNAGILRDRVLVNMTEEDWDLSINVNLKGTFAPLHHAAAYWRKLSKDTGGPVTAAVVNTSSASGLYSAPGQANYAAAKAGVASMSVVAARELARYGVRVNVLAPVAATRLTDSVMRDEMKQKFIASLVPPLVVYLLGAEAAEAGITGRVFEMGGGAISAVNMPLPAVAKRTDGDGLWSQEALARIIPSLVEQLAEPATSASAAKFMFTSPIEGQQ